MDEVRAASLWARSSPAPAWDELAEEVERQAAPATEWMLDSVALQRGGRMLEFAAGPGTLTMRAVRAEGHVICGEFSEAMVEVARRRVAAAGLGGVEFRVLDAKALESSAEYSSSPAVWLSVMLQQRFVLASARCR